MCLSHFSLCALPNTLWPQILGGAVNRHCNCKIFTSTFCEQDRGASDPHQQSPPHRSRPPRGRSGMGRRTIPDQSRTLDAPLASAAVRSQAAQWIGLQTPTIPQPYPPSPGSLHPLSFLSSIFQADPAATRWSLAENGPTAAMAIPRRSSARHHVQSMSPVST